MKETIYSILSVLGFILLFGECSHKIRSKGLRKMNYDLWFEFLKKIFIWWVGLLMLPVGIAMIFLNKAMEVSYIFGNIYNILILVYVYIIGVVITRKLYNWKEANGIDNINK